MNRVSILDMIEISMVKDNDGYSPGIYLDKVPFNGFYIKPIKGSLLDNSQKMAVQKFKLEQDGENYAQDALVELWLAIEKYYDEGMAEEGKTPEGWCFSRVKWKMQDKAKLAKSNVSTCDRSTGVYHINQIESYEQKFIEDKDRIKNQKDERFLALLYNQPIDFNLVHYDSSNKFIQWFHDNAELYLTKKQLEWLSGDLVVEQSSVWRFKKNILKRIEEAYATDGIKSERLKKLDKFLKHIEFLLDFEDDEDLKFRLYKTSSKKDGTIILDLFKMISMEDCEILTKICKSNNEEELSSINCEKSFFYSVIDVLIAKENYVKELIKEIDKESE